MFAGKGRAVWDTVMSGELREMLSVGELEVAVVPNNDCEVFDEVELPDGRLQFRRDVSKILIATTERSS